MNLLFEGVNLYNTIFAMTGNVGSFTARTRMWMTAVPPIERHKFIHNLCIIISVTCMTCIFHMFTMFRAYGCFDISLSQILILSCAHTLKRLYIGIVVVIN